MLSGVKKLAIIWDTFIRFNVPLSCFPLHEIDVFTFPGYSGTTSIPLKTFPLTRFPLTMVPLNPQNDVSPNNVSSNDIFP
jgi:hypothetical protein